MERCTTDLANKLGSDEDCIVFRIREQFHSFPSVSGNGDLDANPLASVPVQILRKKRMAESTKTKRKKNTGRSKDPSTVFTVYSKTYEIRVPSASPLSTARFQNGSVRMELETSPAKLSEEAPFINADGVLTCFEFASLAQQPEFVLPAELTWSKAITTFAAAKMFGFEDVISEIRTWLQHHLLRKNLRSATAAALAWNDLCLLRTCYWELIAALADPLPSRGPGYFGITSEKFSFGSRPWTLEHFAPAMKLASEKQCAARSPPLDGFVICQVRKTGCELCLVREISATQREELLRAELGVGEFAGLAFLYTRGTETFGPVSGSCRQWSEGCCGVLEVSRFGQRFQLCKGVDLLPRRTGKKSKEVRDKFPHVPRTLLGTVTWDMPLLGSMPGTWHLSLEAPFLPALRGSAPGNASGRVELVPPDGHLDTPWVVLGEIDRNGHRILMWRQPVDAALAFAVAISASYPWTQ